MNTHVKIRRNMSKCKNEPSLDFNSLNESKSEVSLAKNINKTISTPRPWVRYFARSIDVLSFSLMLGVLIGIFAPNLLDTPDIVLGFVIAFVWIFIETLLLSSIGTTLGKWLLCVNLTNRDGNKLSFIESFKRSICVWFNGLGMGIPLITMLTQWSAYSKLQKQNITSWDKNNDFIVTHGKVGFIRKLAAIILFIVFFSFIIIGKKA